VQFKKIAQPPVVLDRNSTEHCIPGIQSASDILLFNRLRNGSERTVKTLASSELERPIPPRRNVEPVRDAGESPKTKEGLTAWRSFAKHHIEFWETTPAPDSDGDLPLMPEILINARRR